MKESCDTLREAFREIVQECGIEIFDDASKTRGYIRDLLAEQERELVKYELLVKADGMTQLLDAIGTDEEEQQATLFRIANIIHKQNMTSKEDAEDICRSFAEAIGLKIPKRQAETRPAKKEEIKPKKNSEPVKQVRQEKAASEPVRRETGREDRYSGSRADSSFGRSGQIPYVQVSPVIPGMSFENVPGGKRVARYDGTESVITIPEVVDGARVIEIGPHAFAQGRTMKHLSGVILPSCIEHIGEGAFEGCAQLISCTFQNGSGEIKLGRRAFAATALQNAELPGRVREIPAGCYAECTLLRSATIPDGVETIGEGAYEGCVQMEYIRIPMGVRQIGKNAFSWTGIKEIRFPESVERIEAGAFEGCTLLKHAEWPGKLKQIGDRAFCGCTMLESGELPADLTEIGKESFYGCEMLKSVGGASALQRIGYRAFAGCTMLKKVNLPASALKAAGGKLVFEGCRKLSGLKSSLIQRTFTRRESF